MKQRFVILIFVVLFSQMNDIFSQNFGGFSNNTDNYPSEIISLFSSLSSNADKREAKAFTDSWTIFWNSGILSEEEKKEVIKISNEMIAKKMRPLPHFRDYLNTVKTFFETTQPASIFPSWQMSVSNAISKPTHRHFTDFIVFSNFFFTENTLFKSSTTVWKSSSNDYEFIYDSVPKVVYLTPMTLSCYANNDSSVIYETKGTFYPTQNLWVGEKGKVDWQRAGFKSNELFATFGEYNIDLRKREFDIPSVSLSYPALFGSQTMFGSLEEKVLANRRGDDALYPKFVSRGERFELKNIFENINYEGGITLIGNRMLGSADESGPAYVSLYQEGKLFIKFASNSYLIRQNSLSSDRASISIYWEGDSIFHSGLPIKYLHDKREVSAIREREGLSRAPYFNSYHKIEMDFEALYWKIDEPKIEFRMIIGPGSEGNSNFKSANYFSRASFERIMGIDEVHPLIALRNCANQFDSRTISVTQFATCRRIQTEMIRNQVILLAMQGYVFYDTNTDMIHLKDKLYSFIDASAKRTDYDVIEFNSTIRSESNATLSLLDFDLRIRGVSRVFLSDSQNVYIFPSDQEIIVKKNRDFSFNGRVRVGLFDYFGNNFYFDYDQFKINMPSIDSLSFRVKSRKPDEYGFYPLVKVRSTIEDLSGDLLIDHPSNKSGLKPFDEYPIFNSKKHSFVYYDNSSIYPQVYKRENFFYKIDPFRLEKINVLKTDEIEFHGFLASADIFPDIKQPLKVQDDYSLGFRYRTPTAGLPTYGGKGKFSNLIDLSNQGLRGDGIINYITSTSESDNFVFFPERAVAENVKTFKVTEDKKRVEFPSVAGRNDRLDWKPYEDNMKLQSKEVPFEIYKEKSLLSGILTITPQGLYGDGLMEFNNAEVTSKKFKFNTRTFNTDTCDFRLKTYDLREMAFITENYQGSVDMDKRKGEFRSNGGLSRISFPANNFICYMDQFDWYMDKDEIDLRSKDKIPEANKTDDPRKLVDLKLTGSEFISVHPTQDSLRFLTNRANYNLKDQIIYAHDVQLIRIADAAIVPSDGKVTILRKAEILPLEKAKILANTKSKYHLIYNATVNLYSRNSYKAVGKYNYIDELDQVQTIDFTDIGVDASKKTYAKALIGDSISFTLSPYFKYRGNVLLSADNEFLNFNGGAQIIHDCDTITRGWFKFASDINPKEVLIPVADDQRDLNGNRLYTGLYFNSDDIGIYSTVVSPKYKGGDVEVAASSGYIMYDKNTNEYKVSSKEKLANHKLSGNFFSMSKVSCASKVEGKLSLGANLGRINMNFYGTAINNKLKDSTNINSIVELDFFFNEESMKIMRETILGNTALSGVIVDTEPYSKYLSEILGAEEGAKIITELSTFGQLRRTPDLLDHTFTLIDVNFEYNASTKSYVSVGQIGIGAMGKNQINRYVNGAIEVQLRRGGDRLQMYIEVSPSEWFYFSYANGLMQGFSSDKAFNEAITNTKAEDRSLKAKDNERAYSYWTSTLRRKDAFLKKIEVPDEEN